ncbi:MAG TPA: molybdate ABC transporter substrate-binding protein [Arenimonas sp.]|uniref:molybdate ABC transporter substrate-binding protein n=1 Tax=Arenimonas sp. TaxID=1872635 RepID=UPI002B781E73|nr:molybdate ABC transporter substrate-binding protein [Arenimonas sp.]HMB56461.1 molybdate ABC transporter substrate-binding protein [Arenimonas sp.]
MNFLRRHCFLLLLGLALPALAFAKTPAASPPQITVFAAASLKESLDAVAAEWTRRSQQKVVVSYAASSALAKQIEQGAPADIFISADGEWMDYLATRAQIDVGSRFNLVGNRLVLIAPADSTQRAVALDASGALLKALGDGRLAVAETGSVPAGRYAKQALTKLALWDGVSAHLAQGENVRAAMAYVARGEAPLGIVYATDAQAEAKVRVVATFPENSHDAIIYPAARVSRADAAATKGFLAFLKSAAAKAIFKRAGFSRP